MYFEIVGEVTHVETLAIGSSIRELAEVHWYEAHGIGRKELKIKRYID
jgi:hypothetical protein